MSQLKSGTLSLRKFATRTLLLAGALLSPFALLPDANAQVVISVTPPVCVYGYYEYSPYGCAPSGFYGPGYFHGGVFLGVGPWANWGYGHGWGEYRFHGGGGGRYVAGRRDYGRRSYASNRGHGPSPGHSNGARRAESRDHAAHDAHHAAGPRGSASHAAPHAAASHPHGGEEHH